MRVGFILTLRRWRMIQKLIPYNDTTSKLILKITHWKNKHCQRFWQMKGKNQINNGVDYCGPLIVHYKLRGKRSRKILHCGVLLLCHVSSISQTCEWPHYWRFYWRFQKFFGQAQALSKTKRQQCDELCELKKPNFRALNSDSFIGSTKSNYNCVQQEMNTTLFYSAALWWPFWGSSKPCKAPPGNSFLTYKKFETLVIEIEDIFNYRFHLKQKY